jgi:glutaconate CoA-transferase subunit A
LSLPSNQTAFHENAGQIAARIPDGALLALPPDYSLVAMEVVRALIRRKARNLRLLGVPILGMSADLLIGAGCVAEVETSAVSLGEAGLAPRFTEAVEKGEIKVRDATCPAIHAGLQATEKGVPYMPLRGIAGSDIASERKDWKVEGDLVLIPALRPMSRSFTRAGRTRRAMSGSGAGANWRPSRMLPACFCYF